MKQTYFSKKFGINKSRVDYLRKFILTQKCVPWRVLKFWRENIILNIRLRDIPLDKVFTGGSGGAQFEFDKVLLKESCHVKFLRQFKDADNIDPKQFKKTDYFRHALIDINNSRPYFGTSNEDTIILQAEYFLRLYRSIRDNGYKKNHVFRRDNEKGHSDNYYPRVVRILNSNHYLIIDGHHRFSVYYVLGKSSIKAEVIGRTNISLDEILQKSNVTNIIKNYK